MNDPLTKFKFLIRYQLRLHSLAVIAIAFQLEVDRPTLVKPQLKLSQVALQHTVSSWGQCQQPRCCADLSQI